MSGRGRGRGGRGPGGIKYRKFIFACLTTVVLLFKEHNVHNNIDNMINNHNNGKEDQGGQYNMTMKNSEENNTQTVKVMMPKTTKDEEVAVDTFLICDGPDLHMYTNP